MCTCTILLVCVCAERAGELGKAEGTSRIVQNEAIHRPRGPSPPPDPMILSLSVDQQRHCCICCQELAMEYRAQMIARQRETGEREGGMDRQAMALHHAEQEVVRLQCLLASAAEVAPHICKTIHKVAPDFDFKDRGLQASAAHRKTFDVELLGRSFRVNRSTTSSLVPADTVAEVHGADDADLTKWYKTFLPSAHEGRGAEVVYDRRQERMVWAGTTSHCRGPRPIEPNICS